jgi:hypothetical protein
MIPASTLRRSPEGALPVQTWVLRENARTTATGVRGQPEFPPVADLSLAVNRSLR